MTTMKSAMTSADARIEIVVGDITRLSVDAIVNAANSELEAGGGVCGAIHRAAGPELLAECRAIRRAEGPCPTGGARMTEGYGLPAKAVIHAVGPVWQGGANGESGLLASAYEESLRLAAERGCESIAFPAISTGIFGYPPEQAAKVAVASVRSFLNAHERPLRVLLVAFDDDQAAPLTQALATA